MLKTENNWYDLVFLCINFRFHPYFLNIVKEIGDSHSVCLYILSDKKQKKTMKTEELYLTTCKKYGSAILKEGDECSCNMILMIQPFFNNLNINKFHHIDYNQVCLIQHTVGLNYLKDNIELGAKKLWVYDRKFLDSEVKKQNLEHLLSKIVRQESSHVSR